MDNETLTGLGLSVSVQTCMAQGGMTMLMLQVKGQRAALTDAQVFDASGRPWPTLLQPQSFGGGDEDGASSCQIVVAGKPQPPLSLAFVASGNGAAVTVPILLEHVSFSK